jgi:hypothetical protein
MIERQHLAPYERKLAAILLRIAANEFSNHGCNDFPIEKYLLPEQVQEITKTFHQYNGDPEVYDPEWPIANDAALMGFMASRTYPEEDVSELALRYI